MLRALGELEIAGVATTIPAHVALLSHPDFAAAGALHQVGRGRVDPSVFARRAARRDRDRRPTARPSELVERTVPVEVNGKRFSVRALAARRRRRRRAHRDGAAARPRPGATGAGGSAGNGTITAPMQGTIVKVLVAVGDAVEAGQAVLVLEAMKMENHINAETVGHRRARSASPKATPSAPATSSSSSPDYSSLTARRDTCLAAVRSWRATCSLRSLVAASF